ncbi:hypothetical protein AB0912_23705 [Streptomyces sp. NPDC007084]
MKLGKALATGVAEEQAPAHEVEVELPRVSEEFEESEVSAPEEVPAGR